MTAVNQLQGGETAQSCSERGATGWLEWRGAWSYLPNSPRLSHQPARLYELMFSCLMITASQSPSLVIETSPRMATFCRNFQSASRSGEQSRTPCCLSLKRNPEQFGKTLEIFKGTGLKARPYLARAACNPHHHHHNKPAPQLPALPDFPIF